MMLEPPHLFLQEEGTSLCPSTLQPGSAFSWRSALLSFTGHGITEAPEGHGVIPVLFWCHGNRDSFTQHTLEVPEHF